MASGVWAIVVARVANGAKSRLGVALDPAQRRDLALAMLDDVLAVCAHSREVLAGLVAVVDDPAAHAQARVAGAVVIDDPDPGDMNNAVRLGLAAARQNAAHTAIVLPADIPLVSRHDLVSLVSAAADAPRAVVVGASRDGQGTNALLLRPPDVIAPAFGPPSVERHVMLGQAAGAVTRVETNLGLALDVDTPADLAALADLPVGPRTAALLVLAQCAQRAGKS